MTVKELAEQAGVSIGTVDRVLHGRGRVSQETREKVETLIRSSGYSPNPLARHLKRNRPYIFRVLGPRRGEDSGYWELAYSGIAVTQGALMPFGIRIELAEFDRYEAGAFTAAAEKAAEDADALLIAPVCPAEVRDFTARIQGTIPYAFFDAVLPGSSPVASISQNPFSGGFLAGRLVRLASGVDGSFCAVSSHSEDWHISQRKKGFESFFLKDGRGSTVCFEDLGHLEDAAGAEALARRLLEGENPPRGIFVTSASAHHLARVLRERGIKKDVALVGFDLVKENRLELELGGIDAIISQRPRFQLRSGLEALYRHVVMGTQTNPGAEVALDVYFKENLPEAPAG